MTLTAGSGPKSWLCRLKGRSGWRLVHKSGVSTLVEACDEIRSVLVKCQSKAICYHISGGVLGCGGVKVVVK